ncbi:SDR family oxidoreductase [Flavivirga abyssicola]|uniref:NAD-dependent epimerase/dehydratase family protein n=1 Tax=Flavivirga abyssicola TaxID=3063533 RepID=UPI0026E026FD|nr:SDR family oxidoreductase [Flavivirga sp. MEBiC07777]WVK14801.1 SDR family oxidoreductase [Flavivirga sp. MEBiC07777]
MKKERKAIFFGCNGYLGSHVAYDLKSRGYFVFGFDIHNEPKFNHVDRYIKFDISNFENIKKIDLNVDYVYYFSGKTGTHGSLEKFDQFIDVNEKGLLNVLMCIKEQNVFPKVIFPSTRLVYKGVENTPLSEDAEKEFKTIYALNKFHNEQSLKMFNAYYKIPFTVFRICVPYGNTLSNDYSYGTIGFFLKQAKNDESITLYGEGNLKRTFTYVSDISNQIIRVSEQDMSNSETYNIAGETFSLIEIANLISKKYSVNVERVDWPTIAMALESGDTIFNSLKIEKFTKTNKMSLHDWVKNL